LQTRNVNELQRGSHERRHEANRSLGGHKRAHHRGAEVSVTNSYCHHRTAFQKLPVSHLVLSYPFKTPCSPCLRGEPIQ
jgi:hypothetical protein